MWGWIQKPWQEGDESQNWGEKTTVDGCEIPHDQFGMVETL
jgi:hypothetical protein